MSQDTTPKPWRPIFLPALLTSALLYCAHFPVNLGWLLGWVALVPLLTLVRHDGPRWRIYLAAYLSGVAFFTPILYWLPTSDSRMNYIWAFLVLYGSFYPVVGLWLIRWLDRRTRWPLVLSVPAVWVGLEYVKATALTGFAWYLEGHTQHDMPWLIQVADLGGAWLVSLLVVAVNAYLTELVLAWRPEPRWGRAALAVQGASVALLLGLALGYGAYRLNEDALRPGPTVALVQGVVEQGYRNEGYHRPGLVREFVADHYYHLTNLAAAGRPDLIVWPETAIAFQMLFNPADIPEKQLPSEARLALSETREFAEKAARGWEAALLLGLNSRLLREDGKAPRHNSGIYVGRDGQVAGVYHKIHLVPFGEYVPWSWLARFMPFDYEYMIHPGSEWPRFRLPGDGPRGATFGVLICYEDTDPRISRPYGGSDGQPPADFLLNISNDGWFVGTAEHAQHLAICRFRAVENRRSIARAVNMGISAVVDSNGRVLKPTTRPAPARLHPNTEDVPVSLWRIGPDPADWQALPVSEWEQYEKAAGVLLATVPLDSRGSLYMAWGDWLPWSCWGVVAFGLLWPRRNPSERGA